MANLSWAQVKGIAALHIWRNNSQLPLLVAVVSHCMGYERGPQGVADAVHC